MTFIEQLLIGLETPPWNLLYRAILGFMTLAAFARWQAGGRQDWLLGALLLAMLLALRVVPGVVRKLFPFSQTTQQIWAERRRLAKRYDSYQWQKLWGFGAGLTAYIVISQQLSSSRMVVSGVCMAGGLIGAMRWHAIAKQMEAARVPRTK